MATAVRESIEGISCGWPSQEAVQERIRAARRAVVSARQASEDAVAEAALTIRRRPIAAVGGAAAVGVAFGAICGFAAGFLAARRIGS